MSNILMILNEENTNKYISSKVIDENCTVYSVGLLHEDAEDELIDYLILRLWDVVTDFKGIVLFDNTIFKSGLYQFVLGYLNRSTFLNLTGDSKNDLTSAYIYNNEQFSEGSFNWLKSIELTDDQLPDYPGKYITAGKLFKDGKLKLTSVTDELLLKLLKYIN